MKKVREFSLTDFLLYDCFPAVESNKFIPHDLFHHFKCRNARAVTAVKYSIKLRKLLRRLNDESFFFFGMLALTLHHVESRNNKVGIAVKQFPISVKDIEYAIMSTAR